MEYRGYRKFEQLFGAGKIERGNKITVTEEVAKTRVPIVYAVADNGQLAQLTEFDYPDLDEQKGFNPRKDRFEFSSDSANLCYYDSYGVFFRKKWRLSA